MNEGTEIKPSHGQRVKIIIERAREAFKTAKTRHVAEAERSGVMSRPFVKNVIDYQYEKRGMSLEKAVVLASILGCSLEYLTGASNEKGEPPPRPPIAEILPIVGIVEPGAWRAVAPSAAGAGGVVYLRQPWANDTPIVAYVCRGDGPWPGGLRSGDRLIVGPEMSGPPPHLVERTNIAAGLSEITVLDAATTERAVGIEVRKIGRIVGLQRDFPPLRAHV